MQIGSLRKAMGADGETLIVTVLRTGYRLVRPHPTAAAPVLAPAAATIAVMPFANMSGDTEQDYFADGIVDELITALSRFKTFAVVSRTSTFAYKHKAVDIREVAQELGCATCSRAASAAPGSGCGLPPSAASKRGRKTNSPACDGSRRNGQRRFC